MKHKLYSESWVNAAPAQTILQSLQESEYITNIMMGRVSLFIAVVMLLVWLLNIIGVFSADEQTALYVCWGAFFLGTALFLLAEISNGRLKYLPVVLTAGYLILSVPAAVSDINTLFPYMLLLVLTSGYSKRRFTAVLTVVCIACMVTLSHYGAIIAWESGMVDISYFEFPEGSLLQVSGWTVQNLADYMTAQDYARSWLRYHTSVEVMALAVCGVCCYMVANRNYQVLVRQHARDASQAQIAIELSQNKAELLESNSRLLVSQIQPHFVYNVLNTIYHLCELDSEMAQEAVSDFSDYLRTNLKAMEKKGPIPFSQEREHIETYLRLEKMRFGDRLSIRWDIETENFSLPELSVQPIVENAVKHGICTRNHGGTVTIATHETEKSYIVTVADDGVGFDTSLEMDETHVGIRNVRTRLEIWCRGELTVESAPGQGTTVTISIPKEKKHEDLGH